MTRHSRFSYWPLSLAALGVATAICGGGCSATGGGDPTGSGGAGPGTTGSGTGSGTGTFSGAGGGAQTGGVPQTCAEAVEQQSYIGCEYWPTVTSNGSLYGGFEFAIVAANPTATDAVVTVERAGAPVQEVTVAPGQLQVVPLPWVMELKQSDPNEDGVGLNSALVPGGAYKVTSSVPITLYQFNPLEFSLPASPADCPDTDVYGGCYSMSNDASLLLPKTALRKEYLVMSYPTMHMGDGGSWYDWPGFVAITATENDTQIQVTTTAHVRVGAGVTAMQPGQQGSFTLQAGDVLMLDSDSPPPHETPLPGRPCLTDPDFYTVSCPTAPEYDLTGSSIVASKPVSVIGGHDCTFMPYDQYACDHIEESLFPVETLGQDLIVSAPVSVQSIGSSPQPDSMFIRVLSAADGNEITFDPPVAPNVTLDRGKWTEIGPIATDVHISATDRIMVGQYMVGEHFSGTAVGAGDPSESIAIPSEQFRQEYTFYAPATYTYNFVNVVTQQGTEVAIDGVAIPTGEYQAVGASNFVVARHPISGGSHRMTGSSSFGIVVYGYGEYTSYMYPGGLNLETVTITPK